MVNAQEWLDQNYPKEKRNQITDLNVSQKNLQGSLKLEGFTNLKKLDCEINKLTSLEINNCPSLQMIYCHDNQLTQIKLSQENKLDWLSLTSNNFNQDLSFLKDLVNLKGLNLANNKFYGSLKHLQNLAKLEVLDISNTDIDSGLEYLSDSLKYFDCSVIDKRKDAKVKAIYDLFANEQGKLGTDIGGWIINFPQKLQDYKKWRKLDFTGEEIREWINAGAKLDDCEFVSWFKNTKNLGLEWIVNYKEDYEILSNRFKKYGLCSECNQLNTGENWCQNCNSKRLKQNFPNWTSKNQEIDQFIQKYQLEATDVDKFIEWIPCEEFRDIEYLATGGFGKVYKAKWIMGNVSHWNAKNNQWNRKKDHYYKEEDKQEEDFEKNKDKYKKYKNYREVVLKSLNNSSTSTDFLQETEKHKIIDDWFNNIVPCYGLSQDPKTGNYLMVMQYIEGGDLRKYLVAKKLTFQDKLKRLENIIRGLKDVHQKGLVHRDFHSGNILNSEIQSFITDLGLCKPVNDNEDKEVHGVLPYVAPELLNKNKDEIAPYTPDSDIYSLGMITYEIFANQSPYLDRDYDTNLALDICGGLRPNIDELKIPQLLKDLIKKCWDADPTKRSTANEIEKILRNWQKDSEFINQLKEIEAEYNQISQNTEYKKHPTANMASKLINTKLINQLSQQKKPVEKVEEHHIGNTTELTLDDINLDEIEVEQEQQAQIIQQQPFNFPSSSNK